MQKINRLIVLILAGFAVFLVSVNLYLLKNSFDGENRQYLVSVNRIIRAIDAFEAEKGKAPDDLQELSRFMDDEAYPGITGLYAIEANASREELGAFLQGEQEEYRILSTENYYYRVTYSTDSAWNIQAAALVNGSAVLLLAVLLAVLFYVKEKILRPFYRLAEVPYELSRGNLTVPLKESKNRFFGRFVWGMDLLREHLEETKRRELALQKEKKLLLLSLSHDIKTPLSAIKLYAKALSKNLYKEEEKKREVAEHISDKVDEMEEYIAEIVQASNEDFLSFEVNNRECYTGEVIEEIRAYYEEKLALNQIRFRVEDYSNCLIVADVDRLVEVLQNIIENAVKYGDGGEIRVDGRAGDEAYVITVSNTGCELPDREVLHVFDSFFRGSNVKKQQGSGLGLYICRQLMHRMDGEITASIAQREKERLMVVRVTLQLAR